MKILLMGLMTLIFSVSIYSQDISGSWIGTLDVQGTKLRLVFNITKTENGYSSKMDSPDQGAKDIPVKSTLFENSKLNIDMSNVGIEYSGQLNTENIIIGTFKQGPVSVPLNLKKGEIAAPLRPQEPKPPFSYYTEDLKFFNPKAKINLAGTLTLPKKDGKFPVVVMITGSGPQNRNSEILGHKSFLVIADHLAKNGIGVLRFDDRGIGESEGKFAAATSADFATDVEAAVAYLKNRKEINTKQIGLVGHSEGGMIAPMVAAQSKDIAFIVLLAGPGIGGGDILLSQMATLNRAAGLSEADIQAGNKFNKGAFEIVKNEKSEVEKKLTSYYQQFKISEKIMTLPLAQLSSPWFQFFMRHDPKPVLMKVKCPVLALNGAKDYQVPPKDNLQAISDSLKTGGNKKFTTKELPNLNHLFQESETGLPTEYGKIEQTFSPIALKEISDWINKKKK